MFDSTPIPFSTQKWRSRGSQRVTRWVVRTPTGEILAMHEDPIDFRPWLRAGYLVARERVSPEAAAPHDARARLERAVARAAEAP